MASSQKVDRIDCAALAKSLTETEQVLARALLQRSNRQPSSELKGHSIRMPNSTMAPEILSASTTPAKKWKKVSGKVAAAKAAATFTVAHSSPSKQNHVSARVRLHRHIENIRANPVAVAMIKKKA